MTKKDLPIEYQNRIERFNRLFLEGTKNEENPRNFEENDLFEYEMYCIEQSLNIAKYIKSIDQDKLKNLSHDELYNNMRKENIIDGNHTGNTFNSSLMLATCYNEYPHLIPYLHGSLAYLVGDKGYYDDRSDIPD